MPLEAELSRRASDEGIKTTHQCPKCGYEW